MIHFSNGKRVRVVLSEHAELLGKVGKVHRLRRADDGAWIRMDEPLPPNLRVFPEGDDRARDIILFPDQCEDETP